MKKSINEKRVYLYILLILFLLGSLYIYRTSIDAEKISVTEAQKYLGRYVELQGIVIHAKKFDNGMLLTIRDDNATLQAFLNFQENIIPGTRIMVRGVVTKYRGNIELVVEERDELKIIRFPEEFPLSIILSSPEDYQNLLVRVRAQIFDVREVRDYSWLEISDGINITWVHIPQRYYGDRNVHLLGEVHNGTLYVENILLHYEGEEYKNVSIGKLNEYEGQKVHVYGIILSYYRGDFRGYLKDGEYSIKIWSDLPLKEKIPVVVEGHLRYCERCGCYTLVVEKIWEEKL